MAPTLKDRQTGFPSSDSSAFGGVSKAKPSQPVALEVPVTVNGARALEGADKREPFSEKTTTVLVFANGAVIRLTSAVQPGQLLFLTNEKTRKEVVCEVVKSKSDRNSSGYVELKFTEPVSGFWGLRFPNERPVSSAVSGVAPKPVVAADHSSPSPEKNIAVLSSLKPEIAEEFKTEIKPEARHLSKADLLAPSDSSSQAPKLEPSPLQEQLAALLAMDSPEQSTPPEAAIPVSPTEVATQIMNIADATAGPSTESAPRKQEASSAAAVSTKDAPPLPKSSFDEDGVKVPAWLEPLARNESISAPPSREEHAVPTAQEAAPDKPEPVAVVKSHPVIRKSVPSAAVFGNSLLGETPVPARSTSSGKGMWIGGIAAVLLVGAGTAWYFRESFLPGFHTTGAQQETPVAAAPIPVSAPAADSTSAPSPAIESASVDPSLRPAKSTATSKDTDSSSSSSAQPKLQTTSISERIPKAPSADVVKTPAKEKEEDHIVVVEAEKRPSLGNVRLKKPKVGRSSENDLNAELEPAIDAGQSPISGAALNSGLVTGNTKEPAAPQVEVGGDVRVARMISSVAPVYPALAKAQHISGDVRLDALIDSTGRVTTMKVVSGPTLLHQAAMDALRQWKYQPATLDGKAVAMHLTVTIQFRLQ